MGLARVLIRYTILRQTHTSMQESILSKTSLLVVLVALCAGLSTSCRAQRYFHDWGVGLMGVAHPNESGGALSGMYQGRSIIKELAPRASVGFNFQPTLHVLGGFELPVTVSMDIGHSATYDHQQGVGVSAEAGLTVAHAGFVAWGAPPVFGPTVRTSLRFTTMRSVVRMHAGLGIGIPDLQAGELFFGENYVIALGMSFRPAYR